MPQEALTILVSVLVFGDPLSAANVLGLFVVMVGVVLYRMAKVGQDDRVRERNARLPR